MIVPPRDLCSRGLCLTTAAGNGFAGLLWLLRARTCHVMGVACITVGERRSMVSLRLSGLAAVALSNTPAPCTDTCAPASSGRKNSSTEMSKVIVVT